MIGRLRRGLMDFLDELSARRCRRARREEEQGTVLKGSMRNVIVVRPPGDIFQEAVFIMKDDYLKSPGISREALLRQAREAASAYARSAVPAQRGGKHWLVRVVLPAVLALGVFLALRLSGIL